MGIATYHAYINLPMGTTNDTTDHNLPTVIATYHADNQHTYGILMYRTGKWLNTVDLQQSTNDTTNNLAYIYTPNNYL